MTSAGQITYKLRAVARSIDTAEPQLRESQWTSASRVVLLIGLFLGPWAFGAVQPWAWGGLIGATAVALALWAVGAASGASVRIPWTPLYIPFVGLLLLGAFQSLSGRTVDPIATREALLKGCAYLATFFLAGALFCNASERVWRGFGWLVTCYTLAMSLFAVIQFFAAPGKLYGVIEPRFGGWVFGPYVNRNHYAGLMELLAPVVCQVGFSQRGHARAVAWLVTGLAFLSVVVSGSRAGAISLSLAISAIVLMGALGQTRMRRKAGVLSLAAALVAVLAFAAFVVPPEVSARYEQTIKSTEPVLGDRVNMSRDALHALSAHPLVGVGLGSFETAYPRYQSWPTDLAIDHAHDDYLEIFAEAGWFGGVCILVAVGLAIVLWSRRWARIWNSTVNTPGTLMAAAAAVGVCALLLHSFVDFNLHIPANAAVAAAWFGLSCVTRP